MATIPELSVQETVSAADQLIVYSTGNGQARRASVNALVEYVADIVAEPLNEFYQIYRGALASDPAQRPDGTPNQAGDYYFNTTIGEIKTFDGSGWLTGGINDVYRGALASDPATRPDGSPNVAGDFYFNTTSNTLLTFNGTSWVAGAAATDAANVTYTPTSGSATAVAPFLNTSVVNLLSGWGVSQSNTPAQNTAAINACLQANKGRSVYYAGIPGGLQHNGGIVIPSFTGLYGDGGNPGGGKPKESSLICVNPAVVGVTLDDGTPFPGFQTLDGIGMQGGLHVLQTPASQDLTPGPTFKSGLIIKPKILNCVLTSTVANANAIDLGWGCEQMVLKNNLINGFPTAGDGIRTYDRGGAVNNYASIFCDTLELGAGSWGLNLNHSLVGGVFSEWKLVGCRTVGYGFLRLNTPGDAQQFSYIGVENVGNRQRIATGDPVYTTGSMTAGSNILTIAVAGPMNGDTVTVLGAANGIFGTPYCNLEATVVSGGGTTILTLSANATYSVSNVYVTNALYDSVYIVQGQPTFTNAQLLTYFARFGIWNGNNQPIKISEGLGVGQCYDPRLAGNYGYNSTAQIITSRVFNNGQRNQANDYPLGSATFEPNLSLAPYGVTVGSKGGGHRIKSQGTVNPWTGTMGKLGFAKPDTAGPDIDLWTVDVDNKIEEVNDLRLTLDAQRVAFTNGGSSTMGAQYRSHTNTTETTIATYTLTTPAAPVDKEIRTIATNGEITALTIAANAGQSVAANLSTPFTLARNGSIRIQYLASGTKWTIA